MNIHSSCSATCYGESCDYWVAVQVWLLPRGRQSTLLPVFVTRSFTSVTIFGSSHQDYTCEDLEDNFECDCSTCKSCSCPTYVNIPGCFTLVGTSGEIAAVILSLYCLCGMWMSAGAAITRAHTGSTLTGTLAPSCKMITGGQSFTSHWMTIDLLRSWSHQIRLEKCTTSENLSDLI